MAFFIKKTDKIDSIAISDLFFNIECGFVIVARDRAYLFMKRCLNIAFFKNVKLLFDIFLGYINLRYFFDY